ncbi:ATP-binding cassette sub-family G member 1-like [Amblyomma americanum]
MSVFFALLLSVLYYGCGNRAAQARDTAALYTSATFMMLLEFIGGTVLIFPSEIDAILREQRNCWYRASYFYIARIIAELPFTIICPAIKIIIIHWTTSQPMDLYRIATIILLSIQMCSTSQSIGYVVSTPLNPQMAVVFGMAASAPAILFCGFFVQTRYLHPAVAWFMFCTHSFYVQRGFMFALFGWDRGELVCDERDSDTLCIPIDGDQVLDVMDAKNVDLFAYSGIVLAFDVTLKFVAFGLLKWRIWRKR